MNNRGYSLLEALMVISITVVVSGAAIPLGYNGIDRTRAAGAARYVAGRMATARLEAVRRSAHVAIRFVGQTDGYWLRTYVDGNGNGVLTADIAQGVDVPVTVDERLDHHFSGVAFGILPNVTGLDPGQPFNTQRSGSNRQFDAVELQPDRNIHVGHAVHPGGARHPIRRYACSVPPVRTRIFEFNFGERAWQHVTRERRASPRSSTARHFRNGPRTPEARSIGIHCRSVRQSGRSSKPIGGCCRGYVLSCSLASRCRCFGWRLAFFAVMSRSSGANRSGIEARSHSKNGFPLGKIRPTDSSGYHERSRSIGT